ncbi:MAG: hypothetical protein WAV13_07555 [Thermodesulfovibrionales bacterium]
MAIMMRVIMNVIAGLLILSSPACGIDLPSAKVTLKVVDEKGLPIKGAKASLTFDDVYVLKRGINTKTISDLTDGNGIVVASNNTIRDVSYGVEMDGWYESRGVYRFAKHEAGKWQPWNPEIRVVMRKMEKPVKMYARATYNMFPIPEIPVSEKEVGFDLIESDWVSPYGKGQHPDMIFRLERKFVNNDDFEGILTITFPNKFDGIQLVKESPKGGSMFKLPRYAPEEGYQPKLVRTYSQKGPGSPNISTEEDNNYIIRVRSEEKDGKLFRAMYGKISGDIGFGLQQHKTASILFKYFLNPDYTRNLEYGGNLLKLPEREIQP